MISRVLSLVLGYDGRTRHSRSCINSETNLKPRNAARPTYKLDKAALSTIKGKIHTEKPTHDLYTWSGTITVDGGETPLDIDNLLLRVRVAHARSRSLARSFVRSQSCRYSFMWRLYYRV